MNILIISGGNSSERRISFLSAREVKTALEANKHQVKIFDLKRGIKEAIKLIKDCDVIFPVIHGEEGEGGELQEFLTKIGKPYVGGSPKGYKEGWFKIPFKKFCDKENIPTALWQEVRGEADILKFGLPCVVKSSNGGSSLEVFILRDIQDIKKDIFQKFLKSGVELLVEKLLTGVEVTVGVLNNEVLPVIEIIPPKGQWFDYENKYKGTTKEILNAPSLNPAERREVQKIALKIHQTLRLGSLSRTDFIVVNGIPYVLELNTIPGFTSESLFPKAAGLSFKQLVKKLVETASISY